MSPSVCQICGDSFFSSDLTSDPTQHFCIGLDGPAVIDVHDFLPKRLDSDSEQDRTTIKKKTTINAKPAALTIHDPRDLEEIGRLHMEIEELRKMMGREGKVPKAVAVKA